METTLNRRKQLLIILIVLALHLLLLLGFAIIQFQESNNRMPTHSLEQEAKQLPVPNEESGIELSSHSALAGAPVIFQDEPQAERPEAEPATPAEPEKPSEQIPQEPAPEPEETKPEQQLPKQEELETTIEKATALEVPPVQEKKESDAHDEIQKPTVQEPAKPKSPQPKTEIRTEQTAAKELTLSQLTQGFLNHLKQQEEPYTMATQGTKNGPPSPEQLMYERHLQKIIQCVVKSYQICTSKPADTTQPQEGIVRLSVNRDGSTNACYIVQSTGNRSIDIFALSLFQDAGSSFPPASERLPGNQHTVDFHFQDVRMFGSLMGWGLRGK